MKAAKRFLSVLLTLCMLLSLLPGTVFSANSNVPFTDTKETDWFYDAVGYVYENGMMRGTGASTFSPDAETTRGMIVTILHRMEGTPFAVGEAFTDVPSGQYYSNAVAWASANGIVSGYGNGIFGPNDTITREQMAAILYRYAQYKEYETAVTGAVSTFTDGATVSSYAVEPMNWAVGTGLLSGVGSNRLNPAGNATRAQVAAILMRFCELVDSTASVETYTVTLDYNYGNKGIYKTVAAEAGNAVDKPVNPTRSGYAFAGWYTKAAGGEKFDFEEAVAEDITLYARWNERSSSGDNGGHVPAAYTVTFYMNDGTTAAHTSSSVSAGNAVAEPSDPVREGYKFDGWYANQELTRDYDFESPVNGDLNLYASWDEEPSAETISDEDSDKDSIPAAVEAALGTSDLLEDSDGDGIGDYIEIYEIGSDPTVADSDQDTDGDGLSNYDEVLNYKTHAGKADTDGDGLDDYTEIFTYNTDPLIADTDGDGISDGDEVKTLKTDPLAPTDLSSVDQMLSADHIDAALTSGNDAVPSLYGKADTVLDHCSELKAAKERAISSNRAIIGQGVEAVIPSGADLTLSFSIEAPEEYYIIMELDEKTGWEPLESYHSATSVSAKIHHTGTYCLVDTEILLFQLGVDIDSIYDSIMPSSESVDSGANQVGNDIDSTNSDPLGDELLSHADMIGGEASGTNRILLDDYQSVVLSNPLAKGIMSADGDMLSDWEELDAPVQKDLTSLVRLCLEGRGVPSELADEYIASEDGVSVTVYPYKSNPLLADTDYDGIPDDRDPDPRNNTRSGQMYSYYDVDNAEYTMDFRNFSGDLAVYNRELSLTSLVFSNAIYGEGFNGTDQNTPNITALLEYHGFEHVIDYSLAEPLDEEVRSDFPSILPYTDDDISEVAIGYHDYEYEGELTRVVAVVIRGTNSSIEEWSSNFDLGDPDTWHSEHHKGFYITEERIKAFVDAYADVYGIERDSNNVIYWVTGHSRGAALSNLLSARLIDSGKTVVTYTFATPSTTTDANRNSPKYNSIFNFTNTSDAISYVPLSQWGFGRYGITKEVSIEDSNLESEWCSITGQAVYNALNSSLITIAMDRIYNSCSKSWEEVFDRAGKQRIDAEQYACISDRARKYCDLIYHDYWFSDDLYELYPSTAFVFQLGAEMLAGTDEEKSNALTLMEELWNSKYMVVLLGLLGDSIWNMGTVIEHWPDNFTESLVGDSHALATYYLLIQRTT